MSLSKKDVDLICQILGQKAAYERRKAKMKSAVEKVVESAYAQ